MISIWSRVQSALDSKKLDKGEAPERGHRRSCMAQCGVTGTLGVSTSEESKSDVQENNPLSSGCLRLSLTGVCSCVAGAEGNLALEPTLARQNLAFVSAMVGASLSVGERFSLPLARGGVLSACRVEAGVDSETADLPIGAATLFSVAPFLRSRCACKALRTLASSSAADELTGKGDTGPVPEKSMPSPSMPGDGGGGMVGRPTADLSCAPRIADGSKALREFPTVRFALRARCARSSSPLGSA